MSPADRSYDPNDPYAPRRVRDVPREPGRVGASDLTEREIDDDPAPQFLIDGFPVPASLYPRSDPDTWLAKLFPLARLHLLGALALAGSAAALIGLLADIANPSRRVGIVGIIGSIRGTHGSSPDCST